MDSFTPLENHKADLGDESWNETLDSIVAPMHSAAPGENPFDKVVLYFHHEEDGSVRLRPELARAMLTQVRGIDVDLQGPSGAFSWSLPRDRCAFCAAAASPNAALMACGGCFGTISYCSKEHQKAHRHEHRPHCRKHGSSITSALTKIRASPEYPRCHALDDGFTGAIGRQVNVCQHLKHLRSFGTWVEGLTLSQALAVSGGAPKLIAKALGELPPPGSCSSGSHQTRPDKTQSADNKDL